MILYALVVATFLAVPADESSGAVRSVTGNPVFDGLINYGPIGLVLVLVVVLAMSGRIEFKPSIERVLEDKKLLQDQVTQMLITHEQGTLPALNEALRVMGESARATDAQNERIAALESKIEALTSQLARNQVELARIRGGTP